MLFLSNLIGNKLNCQSDCLKPAWSKIMLNIILNDWLLYVHDDVGTNACSFMTNICWPKLKKLFDYLLALPQANWTTTVDSFICAYLYALLIISCLGS